MAKPRKVRILGVFSNPKGTKALGLMKEQRDILERIALSKHRECFTLDSCPAATIDDLGHSLLQHNYQLLHFGGHGDSEHALISHVCDEFKKAHGTDLRIVPNNLQRIRSAVQVAKKNLLLQPTTELVLRGAPDQLPFRMSLDREKVAELGMAALAFEGKSGELVLPPPAALVRLICSKNRAPVECVVLNACDTISLGQMLIENGVKYVVCTDGRISDECASSYTVGFYDALCAGLPYAAAHDEAMLRVMSKGVDVKVHGAPTLLVNEMIRLGAKPSSTSRRTSLLGDTRPMSDWKASDALSTLLELTPTLNYTATVFRRFTQALGYACDAGLTEHYGGKPGQFGEPVIGAPTVQAMMPMGSTSVSKRQ